MCDFQLLEYVIDLKTCKYMIYNDKGKWAGNRFIYISKYGTLTMKYFSDEYVEKNIRRVQDYKTGKTHIFKMLGD